jgi:hypothetical protein
VCSHRSRKYPKTPPTTIADTSTIGNSKAVAYWLDAESGRFPGDGEEGEGGSSVATET